MMFTQYFPCVISSPGNIMFKAARVCGLGLDGGSGARQSIADVSEQRRKSSCSTNHTYEDAVSALNKLQSNVVTIQQSLLRQSNNLKDTITYLQRSGLSLDDLDKLSVIHVSGTKGKGSTCALTESILKSFGLKTGFFSSPHLISVTERFRINGKPISEDSFTRNFWKVYNRLQKKKEHDEDLPPYFKFLTILAFHIFFEKKVDVAIIEVGIGGLKDCTNILRNTKTIGITSLGLDHTSLLGNTLPEIAYQKAGIIKPNSNVFTMPQPEECMTVIRKVAKDMNAKLFISPIFEDYQFRKIPKLQIESDIQKLNASLAIQLAYNFLRDHKIQKLNGFVTKLNNRGITLEVADQVYDGLENCFWPGRCQKFTFNNKRIHLDGAHTLESLDVCIDWFNKSTLDKNNPKCLIFNATGDRNPKKMMEVLSNEQNFSVALFVPNIPFEDLSKKDNDTLIISHQEQIKRSQDYAKFWKDINKYNTGQSFSCILNAFMFINKEFAKDQEIDILVTGSLHLIGATILALEEFDLTINKS